MQANSLSDKSLTWRYGLNYAAIFFVLGVLGPFFSLFLNGQGFDAATIGFLLALGGPVRVVAGPLTGWVADAGIPLRRIAAIGQLCAALLVLAMISVSALWPMAFLMAAFYATHGPLGSMIDASISQVMSQRATLQYARIRLWGSLAFVAGNLVGGVSAQIASVGIAVLAVVGLCGGVFLSRLLPEDRRSGSQHMAPEDAVQKVRWGVIAAVIAASAAVQSSHAAVYTIGALAWQAQGFSQSLIGVLWMLGIGIEILLFLRIGQVVSGLRRAMLFIAFGGALAIARWLLMASEPDLALTIACQAVHGLTFGATHLGMIAALAELSPAPVRSRIQGSCAAVHALAYSVAIYASGVLYQQGGAAPPYQLMAMLAAGGMALSAMLFLSARQPRSTQ